MNDQKDKFDFNMLYDSHSKEEKNVALHDRFTVVVCALELLATGYQMPEITSIKGLEINFIAKLADQIEESLIVKK